MPLAFQARRWDREAMASELRDRDRDGDGVPNRCDRLPTILTVVSQVLVRRMNPVSCPGSHSRRAAP